MKSILSGLLAGLFLLGCSDGRGVLVQEYIECVADKDIECITSLLPTSDAKYLQKKIDTCMEDMTNDKRKFSRIKQALTMTHQEVGFVLSDRDAKIFFKQLRNQEKKHKYNTKLPTPDDIIEKYEKKLSEIEKGYLEQLVVFSQKEKFSMKELNLAWFDEHYNNETFCVTRYIDDIEFEKLNIIEVSDVSSDMTEVKHEFINSDDSSEKYTMTVEKTDNEWKVANHPYFRTNGFGSLIN